VHQLKKEIENEEQKRDKQNLIKMYLRNKIRPYRQNFQNNRLPMLTIITKPKKLEQVDSFLSELSGDKASETAPPYVLSAISFYTELL